jgi:hypothetical protein
MQQQTIASNYLRLLQPATGYSSMQPQWRTGIGFRSDLDLGVLLTAVLPVVAQGQLIGVLGMDISLVDIALRMCRQDQGYLLFTKYLSSFRGGDPPNFLWFLDKYVWRHHCTSSFEHCRVEGFLCFHHHRSSPTHTNVVSACRHMFVTFLLSKHHLSFLIWSALQCSLSLLALKAMTWSAH